ncbi:hypothetical protein HD806DRAFT_546781 [Xylariaceae sp. AK1471]|nr:hypothetical protein HD806DRAFT_546781 [Xylariaceae sp. AK1471]
MFASKDRHPDLARWYTPGHEKDSEIYARALQKCKEINQDLNLDPFREEHRGRRMTWNRIGKSLVFKEQQRQYDASRIEELVTQETNRIERADDSSNSEWKRKVKEGAYGFIGVANSLKPVIDIFIQQSPEYSIPYACVWIVFKGFLARKDKKDSVPDLMKSLSKDIHIFQAYKDLAPSDDMKITLAELYIHSADLLWRLAKYYSQPFFTQLTDGLLPRAKYNFAVYHGNVANTAKRLKTLCELGNMAKQQAILEATEGLSSKLEELGTLSKGLENSLRGEVNILSNNLLAGIGLLSRNLEDDRLTRAQHQASDLIDIWNEDVGDVEHELRLWNGLRFSTAPRDHWSQNGILNRLSDWRELCDKSLASILWICSERNGRQSWMTEFSLDLVHVCRSQGQPITFALCDRPKGEKWTPKQLLRQLIAQLLNQNPRIVLFKPQVFNGRSFRRATTFQATLDILISIIETLESLVIVIDRLDLCTLDSDLNERQPDLAQALSMLVRMYPQSLRVLVSSASIVGPQSLPGLPISFAKVNTRRRPRKRYDDSWPKKASVIGQLGLMPPPAVRRPTPQYVEWGRLIPHGSIDMRKDAYITW